MQANIHALLLLAVPLATLAAVKLLKRRTPSAMQVLGAIAYSVVGAVAAISINNHMCLEGNPVSQWLIPGLCIPALAVVASCGWRRTIASCALVAMIGLSCHFTELVHSRGWTGNPDGDGGTRVQAELILRYTGEALASQFEILNTELPEGWLRDTTSWNALPPIYSKARPCRRLVSAVWHSPLTGLYRWTEVSLDFWFPGGPLRDGAARIEFRDRDRAP